MSKLYRWLCQYETLIAVLLISLVYSLAYAPWITQLGFYRDDWYQIWSGIIRGPDSIIDLFSIDRPFMGYVYSWAYRLLGNAPLAWHLYAFVVRLIGVLGFFWLLRRLWPRQRWATTAMALLFTVYPGFLQQPNANQFSNHFITYTLSILSILLTVLAVQARKRWAAAVLTVFSMALALAYFPIYEYMIGMEGFRLALLAYLLWNRQPAGRKWFQDREQLLANLRRLALAWLPYLAVMIAFLYWRFFIYHSERPTTNVEGLLGRYTASPVFMLARMGFETFKDVVESLFSAWFVPLYQLTRAAEYKEMAISLILAGVAVAVIGAYVRLIQPHLSKEESLPEAEEPWYRSALWIGGITLVSTLLPMIASGRDVRFSDAFDRYTLQSTAGVVLVLVGLVYAWVQPRWRAWPVLTLVALAVVTHFHNGLDWKIYWDFQRDLWWQMSWRAPQLQDGTVLVARIPYAFLEDYEIWAPANLLYHNEPGPVRVPAEILSDSTIPKILNGKKELRGTRKIEFIRDFNNTLVLSYPTAGSCLHVLDNQFLQIPRDASPQVELTAPISRIDLIQTEGPDHRLPEDIFGPEPAHTWCYYYQKAELARQRQDWQGLVEIGDTVQAQGLNPQDRSEWMPFIEGYAAVGRLEDAENIANLIRQKEPIRQRMCTMLDTRPDNGARYNPETQAIMLDFLCEFN